MSIVCWGNLSETGSSTKTIRGAISDYIEAHDENPNAHMGADYALGAHRLQTELDHPYNSIKYYHVYDIHADRITAGGMVVKGNGPYISVQDNLGAERVKIYPEGIIVKNGRIVVENEGGSQIIDGKGINGGNIFYSNIVNNSTDQRIIGDAIWYNLNKLEHGIYIQRNTPCLIFGDIKVRTSSDNASLLVQCAYNSGYVPENSTWDFSPPNSLGSYGSVIFTHIVQLYAGFNTIKLQGARSSPDAEIYVEGLNRISFFGYTVLGN